LRYEWFAIQIQQFTPMQFEQKKTTHHRATGKVKLAAISPRQQTHQPSQEEKT